jgi:hypothetical protein
MGMTGLGFLVWLSEQAGAGNSANHASNFMPPTGQPEQEIDMPGAEQEAHAALEPGCYINQAILESDQDDGPNAPWEFSGLVSREPVDCPSGRRGKPRTKARPHVPGWPFEEELLKVEDVTGPRPVPDEPGLFQKAVQVHTQVAESQP